ncbi:NUDIX domain-containing protein [Patescibacteria group bacterium]|nr:NUDIX domain-containing protein [Patescibacteria group bacterium]
MTRVLGLAAIHNGHLLICRKIDTWILPGGKTEENEDDLACLERELDEEMPGLRSTLPPLNRLQLLGSFRGTTPHSGKQAEVIVYLGETTSMPVLTSREILEAVWTDSPEEFELSEITRKIVQHLRQLSLIGH